MVASQAGAFGRRGRALGGDWVLIAPPAPDQGHAEEAPANGGGRKPETELDRLSTILKTFNDNFGTLFADTDRVTRCTRSSAQVNYAACSHATSPAAQNSPCGGLRRISFTSSSSERNSFSGGSLQGKAST